MLEIKNDLTLGELKTILKGYFKEESNTDLYQQLVNISQGPRKSAQNFWFQAIELKEKLLLASKENEAEEQFKPELIQKKFLRSPSTGLLNDNVKFQIKPYLDNLNLTDELLIEKIGEAASWEQERQQKLRSHTNLRAVKLTEIQTEVDDKIDECLHCVQYRSSPKHHIR